MTNDAWTMEQTLEQLSNMYRALATLKAEVLPQSPKRFALMAEGPLEEIRRLERLLAVDSGRAVVEEAEADVWLQISGRTIGIAEGPASILTNLLDVFRKGVTATTEVMQTGQLSPRPTKAIKRASDLRVVALEGGSMRVGLRVPMGDAGPDEPLEAEREESVRKALHSYVAVAEWASSDSPVANLEQVVGDSHLRRLLLTEVKRLVPRPKGDVESVQLSGRAVGTRPAIRLTRENHTKIDSAIDAVAAEEIVRYVGDLREIDLDHPSLTLRNVGEDAREVPCVFAPDLLDTALEAVDRRVEVTGVRRTTSAGRGRPRKRVEITRLVILDDDDLDPET